MNQRLLTTIISRVLLVIGAGLCLVFGYWIIQMSLSPVSVPPPPPARKNVTFDARLDISKNDTFTQLHSIGPLEVDVPPTGRENPFAPAVAPVVVTAPVAIIATSTPVTNATSTIASPTSTIPSR